MKKLIIQAFSFFGVSGIGWIVDMCVYTFMVMINVYPIFSNILSSLLAVTFVYLVSTKKLFVNKNNISIKRKYIIYVLYQGCFILLCSYLIGVGAEFFLNSGVDFFIKFSKILAKIFITPFTMITNFIFMKFLIEKI